MSYQPAVYRDEGGDRLVITSSGTFDNNAAVTDASYTIGAEASDVRTINIQLKDAQGNDLAYSATVLLGVFKDATGLDPATTGGSTGIAAGTDGSLFTVEAKKLFVANSEADGDIDVTWTDTGTEAVYLGIIVPGTGRKIMSAIIQNA